MRLITLSTDDAARARRRQPPVWRRRWVQAGAAATLVGGLFAVVAVSWDVAAIETVLRQARWQFAAIGSDAGMTLRDVVVSGRQRTSRDALRNAIGLDRGAPLLAVDPAAVRARVEALPWVAEAAVERRLPDTIAVAIVERRPMAVWQKDGVFSLIDTEGAIVAGIDVRHFAHLPLVVGSDAADHAAAFLAVVRSEPALGDRARAGVRVAGRRWNVVLDNGVEVALPETDPKAAWARLAEFDRTHDLLARDVRTIDLRLHDRLVVQPGTEPGAGAPTRGI